ncbi:MAG: PAS domain-containing protein [Rhizobiaceae bacterium]|nr:PAS domain-containing protein [Rhizobiaceae bacterium]
MHRIDFRSLFETLPSPHMVLDRDLRFVGVNSAYEKAVLRGRDELVGKGLFDLFPNDGESGQRLRNSLLHVFETGESETLAYIPYDIPIPGDPDGAFEQRFWTAVHVPLRAADGHVQFVLQNTVDVTEFVKLRQAASLPLFRARPAELQLLERAREAEDANRQLIAESSQFRRLFQQAPGFFAVTFGPTHVFTFVNDAYLRLIGGRRVVGRTVAEALPEVSGQGFIELLDGVYRTGKGHLAEGARVVLDQPDVGGVREFFLDFSYQAIRDGEDRVIGVFVQGMDRTEAVRTLRRQRLLLDELNHRVKNTLATVLSIASQTLRSARDLPSAKADFESRIIALSKAHNLLSERQWASTDLHSLLLQEVSAYGSERVIANGPHVLLNPKAAIAFALILHELTTNAAKYGALSVDGGKVLVDWSALEDRLVFEWKEEGGPVVAKPERTGFGTLMIERVASGELTGTIAADYAPEGFNCRVAVPTRVYREAGDGAAN